MTLRKLTTLGLAVLVGGAMTACEDEMVATQQSPTGTDAAGSFGGVATAAQPYLFDVRVENVAAWEFFDGGMFNTPAGQKSPGPLFPGQKYEFELFAPPGSYLSFATMMVQSNDLFFAPDEMGIPLYDANGGQNLGDVTKYVQVWDAGTEADEEPGLGSNQAPRQSGGNTGPADPNNTVRLADDSFGNLPAVSSMIKVVIESRGPNEFYVTLENRSNGLTLFTSDDFEHPVPMAPGVYVVHTAPAPLFTVGAPDRGEGLEGVAEDGANGALAKSIASRTGVVGPIAPGVYAVQGQTDLLFTANTPDRGLGLEALAEDGNPGPLAGAVAASPGVGDNGVFNTPEGAAGPGPAFPGDAYTFTVMADAGDRFTFATMYVQSNDLFFAPDGDGIALFENGMPINGDITHLIQTWDAGTEVDEVIGLGANQAPRQSGPNTGADENGNVRVATNVSVAGNIRVTVTARKQ